MGKYNDELLTPENYAQMAKEYNKSIKKNIKFVEIKIDDNKKQNLLMNIYNNANNMLNCLNYLNKCNLRISKRKLLDKIFNFYQNHNNFVKLVFKDKQIEKSSETGKNYCDCLVLIINNCTKSINIICELKDFFNEEEIENYFNQIQILNNIINCTTQMFGICRYRD